MSKIFSKLLPPKLVACELGPNYSFKDLLYWWLQSEKTENYITPYVDLGNEHFWVDSGRTGLALFLKSLNIQGEVLLQAYSCVVVPNSVLQAGLTPVVIDIEKNGYNIDLDLVEKSINKKTKVLIIQHTYGIPVNMDRVMEIIDKYNLILLEDMAHALGNSWNGKLLGSFGHGVCIVLEGIRLFLVALVGWW